MIPYLTVAAIVLGFFLWGYLKKRPQVALSAQRALKDFSPRGGEALHETYDSETLFKAAARAVLRESIEDSTKTFAEAIHKDARDRLQGPFDVPRDPK